MLNKRNKWCLSLGCIGRDMSYTLVSLFLLTYLQYTGLFNTQQFIVLSVIIVICRIWDAVNDPMMGTIITNTRTRFGKYRPWVIIGALANSIVLVAMFLVRTDNGWLNVAIIGVLYLLWGMTFTMNDISYWDLLPALTSDKKERDNLTSLVAVFASVGAFAAGGIVPMVTPGNMIVAYRIVAIVCAVVFLGCQIMVFFGVHDNKNDTFIEKDFKRDVVVKKEDTVSLKGMIKILFNNKQLLVMAVVVLLYTTASSMLTAFGQNYFYFKFGYLEGSISGKFGGGTLVTIFTVVFAAGTLISQAIYPSLAAKFKRDKLVFWSIAISILGYIIFFVLTTLLEGVVLFVLLCIFSLIIFAGQGVFYLTMLVMLTNTIEYGEWQTGKNHAAITFTVRPFMVKLSSALQYGVVVLTLIICGVYSITNQVGEVEVALGMLQEGKGIEECIKYLVDLGHDAGAIGQGMLEAAAKVAGGLDMDVNRLGLQLYCETLFVPPSGALVGMAAMMSIVPILCLLGSYFIIKKKYIISEEKYDEILKELEERKQAN